MPAAPTPWLVLLASLLLAAGAHLVQRRRLGFAPFAYAPNVEQRRQDWRPKARVKSVFWIADRVVIALLLAIVAFVFNHLMVRSRASWRLETNSPGSV